MVLLILIATFIFQPIRNWIQDVLDRYWFYRDRYDYRRTLIEFVRELSSEKDLAVMLDSVTERLKSTLLHSKRRVLPRRRRGQPLPPMHEHRAGATTSTSVSPDVRQAPVLRTYPPST
jgi:hypothetical protein